MTTARDMITMLRRHYLPENRPSAGIFAPEITAPGGQRRADLIFQGCTAAVGSEVAGHEVKVSRADVLVELADLAKSDPWQRYCDRWWLVVSDPALVDGLDLPPSWGVMAPPSGRRTRSMTVLTPAPQLNPIDQAPAFKTISAWLHWRVDEADKRNEALRREVDSYRTRAFEAEARAPRQSLHESKLQEQVERIVRELGGPGGFGDVDRVGSYSSWLPVETVIDALRDLGSVQEKVRDSHRRLHHAAGALKAAASGIDRLNLDDLAAAIKAMDDRTEGVAA